jgi:hypothetical protein
LIWKRNENIIEFHLQFHLHNKYNFLFALYKDANTTNTTAKPQQQAKSQTQNHNNRPSLKPKTTTTGQVSNTKRQQQAKSQTQNDIDETTIIKANHDHKGKPRS